MPKKFIAYTLRKEEDGLSYVEKPVIGLWEDVCFLGSQPMYYPQYINYKYDFLKVGMAYPSL